MGFLTFVRSVLAALWAFLEPLLELEDNRSRLIAASILLLVSWLLWRRKRRRRPTSAASVISSALGADPSLLEVCRHLASLIAQQSTPLGLPPALSSEASSIVEDLEEGRLRLYVFGHQNAGKSSLINELLDETLTPESSGKFTACLVRLKHGPRLQVSVFWKSGVQEQIKLSALEKRMTHWAQAPERPREVLIETPRRILDAPKVELIDSPGTGSEWSTEFHQSLEDELVAAALKSAAVAILVYRYWAADMEAHSTLLRQLAESKVPTLAVCNLDPNWAEEYRTKRSNIERTIGEAEVTLRRKVGARCYRVAVHDSSAVKELLADSGAHTLDELRTDLQAMLRDRTELLKRQAMISCQAVIEAASRIVQAHIERLTPIVQKADRERAQVLEATAAVRLVLAERIQGYSGTAFGAGAGGVAGTVAAVGATAATA